MNNKNLNLFETASIPKAVISNVVPAIISMLMVLIYNLADTFFIGQTKNAYMVAAVSVATPIFLLFMAIGMLFGIGGTSLISRTLGEQKVEKAKHISSFCFWSSTVIGILGMLFIWICMDFLCKIIGTSTETIEYVKEYLQIVAVGIPFLIISNSFSNIIRAEGKAILAMTGMIIGNLANVVLDPIMILGFGWNVKGAAIATVIGNMIAAGFYIFYYLSGKSMLSIKLHDFSTKNHILSGVLAIGIPASLNSILMSFSNIIINNLMNQYGDMAVAGLGVALKVNMIAVMLLIGLGTGIQPLLGYCYGAGNRKRFKGVLSFSLISAVSLSIIMSIICYTCAKPMVNAFLQDPNALTLGMNFARILIISGPVIGILFVMTNAIQSMGAAIPSLILSISRQGLIYIPIVLIFNAMFHTSNILVAAQPVADYISVFLSIILFIAVYKKYFSFKEDATIQTDFSLT